LIKDLFNSSKNYTEENLLNELLKPIFVETSIEKIYSSKLDINWKNIEGETILHLCTNKNLVESIKWLIKKGVNLELENLEKETALFNAAKLNYKEIIKLFIKNNVNLDHQNRYKRTALQEAVISGNIAVSEILLQNVKNLNNIDEHGHNLIFDAVSNGNIKLIEKISSNKNININQIDKRGNSILLQKECLENDLIAEHLLEAGANPTLTDRYGKNFLFYTAIKGIESEHLIDKALSTGCDINSRSKNNQTVLMEVLLAFSKLSPEEMSRRDSLFKMAKKLIKKGIDINAFDNDGETALFIAVRALDIESIKTLLLDPTLNIDHQNKDGDTILSLSCMFGIKYLDVILLLLNCGANVNIKDKNKQSLIEKLIKLINYTHNKTSLNDSFSKYKIDEQGNYFTVLKEVLDNSEANLLELNQNGKPLFFDAIFYKNDNLFKLLRKYGSDLNQKDSTHHNIIYNVMSSAVSKYNFTNKEYLETLEQLIKKGIDINSRDSFGGITAHKAILDNCEQTLKLLLNARADINAVDIKGRNLVHNCVWKGKVKQFKLLIKYNLEVMNQPDKFGVLPINYAAFMGHKDLVLEMITAGAYINNNYKKNNKMLEFLSQFNNNLDEITLHLDSEFSRKKILMLVENMRSEFKL